MPAGRDDFGTGGAGRNVWLWPGVALVAGTVAVAMGLWRFAPPPALPSVPAERPAPGATAGVPAAAPAPEPPAARPPAAPDAPRFDVVRVEPGGDTLVAGRAMPGKTVEILVDGKAVGAAETDATGQFVAFVGLQSSAEPRVMSLAAEDSRGAAVASAETVIVAPDGSVPAGQVVAGGTLSSEPAPPPDATAPADVTPAAAAAPEPALPAAAAPRVLLSDAAGVRPLDVPPLEGGAQLRLDSVDYGDDDAVVLRGRSAPGATLRAYLDGAAKGDVTAAGSGLWEAVLSDIPAGLYRLRIDRIDTAGAVTGRVEVPFRREAPEVVRSALSGSARVVTVQPGATLWAIARDRYGDGMRYVSVYETNRIQIKDPDLIYPGQVFDLPAGAGGTP